MHLAESGEMYLETILILSGGGSPVHAIDIGEYMGFSKPSVSRAMSLLKQDGYISVTPSNGITLTPSGRAIAENIYEKHTLLSGFLMRLGVDEETALRDACKIEHDISDETFSAIKRHAESIGAEK